MPGICAIPGIPEKLVGFFGAGDLEPVCLQTLNHVRHTVPDCNGIRRLCKKLLRLLGLTLLRVVPPIREPFEALLVVVFRQNDDAWLCHRHLRSLVRASGGDLRGGLSSQQVCLTKLDEAWPRSR